MTTLYILLLCLCFQSTKGDTTGICGENVILKCPAKADRVEYRAVSWYRVSEGHLSGIILWNRKSNTIRRFANLTQVVECPSRDGLTLEIQNLTTGDGGVYRCSLWAPVGQVNRQGEIQLSVKGCSDGVDSRWTQSIVLCGAAALLLICTLMLLYIRTRTGNPIVETYVHNAPFLKKPYGLLTEDI